MKNRYLLILFVLLTLDLFAVEGKVKVFVTSQDAVYTSQKVIVAVELLSDAFSIADANIRFPSSSQYIVQAPQSAAYLGKAEVNGTDWQMVHYEYELYALSAGQIDIPAFDISFTASMGYGQPKKAFELKSEALTFKVKSPEGIKPNQFVLVTDNYSLTSEVKPDKKQLIVGDAVEFSVTQKAHNVPDILLRPMRYKSNTHIRVYEKEPLLQSELKGKYDVSRTDSFTFVASAEGNVTIAAQESVWWNSQTKKAEKESIPAIHFEIIPDPQIALDAQAAKKKKWMMIAGVAVMGLLLLWYFLRPVLKRYRLQKKAAYEVSEEGRFKTLINTLKSGTLSESYTDFYAWSSELDPALTEGGFRGIGQMYPSFEKPLKDFENALTESANTFDVDAFIKALKAFREDLLSVKEEEQSPLVVQLNP